MKTVLTTLAVVSTVIAAPSHAAGDPARGKTFYTICATCHGQNGEGVKEMNGPRLAGQQAWYIARQLENFKSGIRGRDPADVFGAQMAPMAAVLPDAQAIEDVAAYLEALGSE